MVTRLVGAAVVICLGACEKHEPRPELAPGYSCRSRPPDPTPTRLDVDTEGVIIDPSTCEPGAIAHGGRPLGSWTIELRGKVGAACVYDATDEMEGGYTVVRCEVPAVGARTHLPIPASYPRAGCVQVKQGNVFSDRDTGTYDVQLDIPGTQYVVWSAGGFTGPRIAKDAPKVAHGSRLRVAFRLFDDEELEQPTVGPRSTGEITFRSGAGEVGTAIERVFGTGVPQGAAFRVRFREEVAHGLRDKLPSFPPEASICAELALVEVTAAAPPTAAAECPAGQLWRCQLGPTSVERRSDARICGCGYEHCLPPTPFLWSRPGEGTWPDGTRKASFECVDDHERIRRSKALRP